MNFTYNRSSLKHTRRVLRRNQTDAEWLLWRRLRNKQLLGLKFYRQYSIGPYIVDFYCPTRRLVVELDGSQHMESSQKKRDEFRSQFLKQQNIRVLRFWDNEALNSIQGVLEVIAQTITPSNSPLS